MADRKKGPSGAGSSFSPSPPASSASGIFQQLRDIDSDFAAVQSRLDQIRSEFRLGHAETADRGLSEILSRLEQDPAARSGSGRRSVLLAEAKALQGTVLHARGKEQEAQKAAQQAVAYFEHITAPPADDAGQFQGDYGLALALLDRKDQALLALQAAWKAGSSVPEVSKYLGLLRKEKGDWAGAEEPLVEAAQANPADAGVRLNLAQTLEKLGKTGGAAEVFREAGYLFGDAGRLADAESALHAALRLAPEDADATLAAGEVARRMGKPQQAVLNFQRVLDKNADDLFGWTGMAAALLALDRPAEALSAAERALALSPGTAKATLLQSQALEQLGDLEKAERCLDPGLEASPVNRDLLLRKGDLLYARGALEQMLPLLDRALKLAPGEAYFLFLKGRILHLSERNDEACTYLSQAVAHDPSQSAFHFELASALRDMGQLPQALEAVDKALALDPEDGASLELKTRCLIDTADYQAALEAIERALAQDPQRAESWGLEAEALYGLGKLDEALAALKHVLELAPGSARALWQSARIQRERGDLTAALALAGQVLVHEPDNVDALFQKGLALAEKSPQAAVPILMRAVELAPDSRSVHFQLADVYRRLQDYPKALAELERCLALDAADAGALALKGQVLVGQGHLEQALTALDRATRVNPQDVDSQSLKAWVLMDLNRPREAAEVLRRLTGSLSDSGYYQAQLGEALRRCGEWEEARAALDRAVALSPEEPFVLACRSDFLCDIGEFEEAAKASEKSVSTSSDDPWKYGLLGWALENVGEARAADALAAYERALELDPAELGYLKGKGNALRLMGKKSEACSSYSDALKLARTGKRNHSAIETSVLGWCHYGLGQFEEAIRLYSSALSSPTPNDSDQFDLALALLCTGRYSIALTAYTKGVEDLKSRHVWHRKALYHVGFYDLLEALADPEVKLANSAVREVAMCFDLLKNGLEAAGRKLEMALPPPKATAATF
jgi:tetratricopeptide (TPR) repeat protein